MMDDTLSFQCKAFNRLVTTIAQRYKRGTFAQHYEVDVLFYDPTCEYNYPTAIAHHDYDKHNFKYLVGQLGQMCTS